MEAIPGQMFRESFEDMWHIYLYALTTAACFSATPGVGSSRGAMGQRVMIAQAPGGLWTLYSLSSCRQLQKAGGIAVPGFLESGEETPVRFIL